LDLQEPQKKFGFANIKKKSLNEVFLHTGFPLMALAINFQDGPVYV